MTNVQAPSDVPAQGRADVPYALLWRVVRPRRADFTVALVLSLLVAVLTVVQPRYVQRAVESLVQGVPASGALVWLAGVTLLAAIASGFQVYMTQRAAEGCARDLRERVVDRLMRVTVEAHDRANSADLLSRAVSDTALVKTSISGGLLPVLGAGVTLVGIVVFMVVLDPLLVGITLAVVVVACVLVVLVGRTARETSIEMQDRTGAFAAATERALAGIRTVKAFNAEEVEAAAVRDHSRRIWAASMRLARLVALVQPTVNLCMQAALVVVVVAGAARVAGGHLSLGGLLAYTMYMVLMVMPVSQLSQAFTQLQVGRGALARLDEIDRMETEPALRDGRASAVAASGAPRLEMRGVSLAYEPGREVLRDVWFTVGRGQKVAVVGRSGAGKSSLVELVEGFYEPDAGVVLVDGAPLDEHGRAAARSRMVHVPQDPAVLTGTLRENLVLGRGDVPDADLLDALARVGLEELARRSDAGLDVDLGQAGIALSGGQRQRLAWARVLLSDADLVLLDEPTSNLDLGTEALMVDLLEEHGRGRTVITITHRPDVARSADLVLVVDDGHVHVHPSAEAARAAHPGLVGLVDTRSGAAA